MASRRDLSSGWITYEVLRRDATGRHTLTPFSDSLAISGSIAIQAITKMRMVQDLRWPEAKRVLRDDKGRLRIVRKDEVIWLLKCKPSCWRLYFYVWDNQNEKRIIYLLAICKKTDAENSSDAIEARRIYDGIRPGGSAITPFEFQIG